MCVCVREKGGEREGEGREEESDKKRGGNMHDCKNGKTSGA